MAIFHTLRLSVGELRARITQTPATTFIDVHGDPPQAEDEEDLYEWIESLFDVYRGDPRPIEFLWVSADYTRQMAPSGEVAWFGYVEALRGSRH